MASHTTLYEEFRGLAASWPTAFVRNVDPETQACCALHRPVVCGVVGALGCRGLKPGTHASIRALYTKGVYYCHAEVGQKVIDQQLFKSVVELSDGFVNAALPRTNRFKKRFMAGFPIDVSCYGAGFCYLGLMDQTARSRVARCLGPFPLVADVVRMMMFVGDKENVSASVVGVDDGCWHVEDKPCGSFPVYRFLVRKLFTIVEHDPFARIGATAIEFDHSVVDISRLRKEIAFLSAGGDKVDSSGIGLSVGPKPCGMIDMYASVVFNVEGNGAMQQAFARDRMVALKRWFTDRGVTVPYEALDQLAIATCASACLPTDANALKKAAKLWAVLGDSILKVYMAAHCIASAGDVSMFTQENQSATNAALGRVFLKSGLRDVCLVSGLSVESKGNADILEAVIGVISMHCKSDVILNFLHVLGLIPRDASFEETVGSGGVQLRPIGMSSRQHAVAMRLCELNVL